MPPGYLHGLWLILRVTWCVISLQISLWLFCDCRLVVLCLSWVLSLLLSDSWCSCVYRVHLECTVVVLIGSLVLFCPHLFSWTPPCNPYNTQVFLNTQLVFWGISCGLGISWLSYVFPLFKSASICSECTFMVLNFLMLLYAQVSLTHHQCSWCHVQHMGILQSLCSFMKICKCPYSSESALVVLRNCWCHRCNRLIKNTHGQLK